MWCRCNREKTPKGLLLGRIFSQVDSILTAVNQEGVDTEYVSGKRRHHVTVKGDDNKVVGNKVEIWEKCLIQHHPI